MRRLLALSLASLVALSTGLACRHETETAGASTAPASSSSGAPVASETISPPGDGACGGAQCIRRVRCVQECNGAAVQTGCCPCPAGSFDDVTCPRP